MSKSFCEITHYNRPNKSHNIGMDLCFLFRGSVMSGLHDGAVSSIDFAENGPGF